ncbi:hypothetical protein Q2T40_16655 [Winogradskyella maritima]|uniref:Uncharacterized protein n=1 Tax=Winogradskyella maritima TaxID=1517766 RepID=A0ABV8AG13_9FLAO|nr:hypothetical protein [Winogradskyella maritima]
MKALKITLLLVAVLVLTVSVVKSNEPAVAEKQEIQKTHKSYDLLAHCKKKLKAPNQG